MIYSLDGIVPEIAPTVWVAPDANVIGRITLMADVSIWFGATLRGDSARITVGQGSNVQENCCLHTDMDHPVAVGPNCTIGHKVMLHGCTIGEGTLIGMSATILNGAKIGRGCLIGAGTLVTEGKEIPDFSLVMGAPGKVVGELDEAARARLIQSAVNYQANARRFRKSLCLVADF